MSSSLDIQQASLTAPITPQSFGEDSPRPPSTLDYENLPAFLIDASVFPGSSGSPVFLWNPGTYRARSGGVVVGTRFLLLGILAAVHVRKLLAEVVPVPTRVAAVFDEPIDLGIVYKASAIAEVLDLVAERYGFTAA